MPRRGRAIERTSILGTTGPAIEFDRQLAHVTLRDLWVDGVASGWLGSFTESGAPACDAANLSRWITTTNASSATDCSFSSGTGAARAHCVCSSGGWAQLPPRQHAGIEIAAANPPSHDVLIERTRWPTNATTPACESEET